MNVIITQVPVPAGKGCGTPESLENTIRRWLPQDAQAVYYWYTEGSYEGSGRLLLFDSQGCRLYSLDHCSCNDPLDHECGNGCYGYLAAALDFHYFYNCMMSKEAQAEWATIYEAYRMVLQAETARQQALWEERRKLLGGLDGPGGWSGCSGPSE